MSEHMNRLLADFGNALGLEGLSLDDKGYCCLSFDELLVNIEAVGESALVLLYSSVGVVPEDAAPAIYRSLLDANYFFQGTAGATVGLNLAAGTVVLTRVVDTAPMQVLDWEGVIQGFVDAAESCARRLLAPEGAVPQDTGWDAWPQAARGRPDMTSIQNSPQLFRNFLDAASQHKELILEEAECRPVPAKTGFMSRLVNWLSGGESTRKVYVDTRQAFLASIQTAFGAEVAQMCVKELKFQPASKTPLSSREIRDVAALVTSDKAQVATNKALDKLVRNFARKDEMFRSGLDAFARVRHPNSRQLDRLQRETATWVELKDRNYDEVAALNLQMENMRKLRDGL